MTLEAYIIDVPTHRGKPPGFVAVVMANPEGIIVESAPILRWSMGQHIDELTRWARERAGKVTAMTPG